MDFGRFSKMGKDAVKLSSLKWLWKKFKSIIFCKKMDEEQNEGWNDDWVKEKFD